jgi:hypothetical protein
MWTQPLFELALNIQKPCKLGLGADYDVSDDAKTVGLFARVLF